MRIWHSILKSHLLFEDEKLGSTRYNNNITL